jgi:hypothetical protein
MVLLYEKTIAFAFFTIHFTHVVFPQSFNSKLNNEQHNFENKDLENNRLKV